ncbi:MAG: hypothetical protein MHM6MM_008923 [Cercozoa sp. M6MM]
MLPLPADGGNGTAGQKLRLVSSRAQLKSAADEISTGALDAESKSCSRELSFAQFFRHEPILRLAVAPDGACTDAPPLRRHATHDSRRDKCAAGQADRGDIMFLFDGGSIVDERRRDDVTVYSEMVQIIG